MHPNADVLQGTLDLLILKAVSLQPMHGWGISQRIQQISRGVLEVNQGALYPALHRLQDQGWLDAEWGTSDNNRRAKFIGSPRPDAGNSPRKCERGSAMRT